MEDKKNIPHVRNSLQTLDTSYDVQTQAELPPSEADNFTFDERLAFALAQIDDDRTTDDWNLIDAAARTSLALRARVAKLEAALKEIAKQMINAEMDEQQHRYADYEGAYEAMIKVARAALKDAPE